MKNSIIFAFVILLLGLYPSSNAVTTIRLSALRPDLEFFRGVWLQNPENGDMQGRIIFSNRSEIVVNFEHVSASGSGGSGICSSEVHPSAWRKDSLQLGNIDTAVKVLFYKHGTFYIRRYECDLPEVLDKESWVKILPIKPENDRKESIEIRYISLKTMGREIEQELSRIDAAKTGMEGLILKSTKSSSVTVSVEDNQFSFDYEKGRRFVEVRDVRTIQFTPQQSDFDEQVLLYKVPESFVDFAVTRDYHFIRYDRRLKAFSAPGSEELDSRWMVRSNIENRTVLRVGYGSFYRTICGPPHLCSYKSAAPRFVPVARNLS